MRKEVSHRAGDEGEITQDWMSEDHAGLGMSER